VLLPLNLFSKENFNIEFKGKILNLIEEFYSKAKFNFQRTEKIDTLIHNYIYSIIINKKLKFIINTVNCDISNIIKIFINKK
jgi:hypothetical protein